MYSNLKVSKIASPRCQQIRGHDKDYTRTLLKNCLGFSQILNEQSGEERNLGVFTSNCNN